MGGLGFLGYKIVEELLENDFSVKIGISENKNNSREYLVGKLIETYGDNKITINEISSFKQNDCEEFLDGTNALIISAKNHQK